MPIAFSAGFHPHPRISYANAASTGTASEAEYVELALTHQVIFLCLLALFVGLLVWLLPKLLRLAAIPVRRLVRPRQRP